MDARKLGLPEQILPPRRKLVPGLVLSICLSLLLLTIFYIYPSANSHLNSFFSSYNPSKSHFSRSWPFSLRPPPPPHFPPNFSDHSSVANSSQNQISESIPPNSSDHSTNQTPDIQQPIANSSFLIGESIPPNFSDHSSVANSSLQISESIPPNSSDHSTNQTLDIQPIANSSFQIGESIPPNFSDHSSRCQFSESFPPNLSDHSSIANSTFQISESIPPNSSDHSTNRTLEIQPIANSSSQISESIPPNSSNHTLSVEPIANSSIQINKSGNGNGSVCDESKNVREKKAPNENGKKSEAAGGIEFDDECDIYDGRWVRDESKPYYPPGSCPYIDRDFDCFLNKRPEDAYVKWKWQPNHCNIPSLNATHFLEMLRGKSLVFVGDSLNRNMWESLLCILRHSVPNKDRVYEISGRTEFKKEGFYAFRFEDYNCSVDFVNSPFLVMKSSVKRKNETIETLRLDLMDPTTTMYRDSDVLVFNTGHWWTHEKTSKGEDYYQEGNHVHPKLKVLEAFKRGLTTWGRWIDNNVDGNRTLVFFRGYSYSHFSGGQWNSGGQCDGETEPIFNETHLGNYPKKMRALEYVMQGMKTPVSYINITRLTHYRKDAHPSIYRMEYKTEEERRASIGVQDCSHWCLPGVPDTWNELLYVSLLRMAKKVWSQ